MNLNFLKQNIINICNEINKNKDKVKKHSIEYNGVFIPRLYFDNLTYRKTLEKLTNTDGLKNNLSFSMIVGMLNRIIGSNLEKQNISQSINEDIEEFKEFASRQNTYDCYVPIKGIKMDKEEIQLSDKVKIKQINQKILNKCLPGVKEDAFAQLLPVALEVRVTTADFQRAMELTVDIGKLIVNFLRLVDYFGWDDENLSVRLPGYGSLGEELRVYAVNTINRDCTISWQPKEGDNEVLELDNLTLDDIKDIGGKTYGVLLDNYLLFQINDMQKSVLRAITWFGESKTELEPGARFLKLTLAIECLLNTNTSDPITATLRDRMAFILGETQEERLLISKQMNELYNQRSRIVHHGSSNVNLETLLKLESLTADLIVKFLADEKYSTIQNKKELQDKLELLKFS